MPLIEYLLEKEDEKYKEFEKKRKLLAEENRRRLRKKPPKLKIICEALYHKKNGNLEKVSFLEKEMKRCYEMDLKTAYNEFRNNIK